MSKKDGYRQVLRELQDWEPYLLKESNLPGPRGNLELAYAAAEEGDAARFERLLRYGPDQAPANTPAEFLHFCGVIGLGKMIASGRSGYLPRLRLLASDPRWRTREAVAIGLQWVGDQDMEALLQIAETWLNGSLLEQRAVVAALAEPRLLKSPIYAAHVLEIFDRITAGLEKISNRRSDDFRVLRQALGYAWSVAVAALPSQGIPLIERWLSGQDPDIHWIMEENLKKSRLKKAAPECVMKWIKT